MKPGMDERLDRLEAMLIELRDQVERLSRELPVHLRLNERRLRRLEARLDANPPALPAPLALEPAVEERS